MTSNVGDGVRYASIMMMMMMVVVVVAWVMDDHELLESFWTDESCLDMLID